MKECSKQLPLKRHSLTISALEGLAHHAPLTGFFRRGNRCKNHVSLRNIAKTDPPLFLLVLECVLIAAQVARLEVVPQRRPGALRLLLLGILVLRVNTSVNPALEDYDFQGFLVFRLLLLGVLVFDRLN